MTAIIGLRPTVSNRRPSRSGPRKLPTAKRMMKTGTTPSETPKNVAEERAEVEGDGVVEERLADEQREAEDARGAGSC